MKYKIFFSILFFSLLFSLVSAQEIRISNCEELQNIPKNSGESYVLNSDIDCSVSKDWNNGEGFKPIDNFKGEFDGKRYSINNLYINRPLEGNVGLFGSFMGNNPSKNPKIINLKVYGNITGNENIGGIVGINHVGLHLENVHFSGNIVGRKNIGGLVGWNGAKGTIISSSFSGSIRGTEESKIIGGLVGWNAGNAIVNSTSNSFITGDEVVGGIVGYNSGRIITNCQFDGEIISYGWLGGIVGTNKNSGPTNPGGMSYSGIRIPNYPSTGKVEKCQSSGDIGHVDVYSIYVGGIVGLNQGGNISDSCSDAFIMGGSGVGGIIGGNLGKLERSYFSGDTTGSYFVGGLVGINGNGSIKDSYFAGNVWSFNQHILGKNIAGLLIGNNDLGVIENSYYYKGEITDVENCYSYDCRIKKEGDCASFGEEGCGVVFGKDYFYQKDNSPMDKWDFLNAWDERELNNPVLKEYISGSLDIRGEEIEYTPMVSVVIPDEVKDTYFKRILSWFKEFFN